MRKLTYQRAAQGAKSDVHDCFLHTGHRYQQDVYAYATGYARLWAPPQIRCQKGEGCVSKVVSYRFSTELKRIDILSFNINRLLLSARQLGLAAWHG